MTHRHRWRLKGILWILLIFVLILNTEAKRKKFKKPSSKNLLSVQSSVKAHHNHDKSSAIGKGKTTVADFFINLYERCFKPNEIKPVQKHRRKRSIGNSFSGQKAFRKYADFAGKQKPQHGRAVKAIEEDDNTPYICEVKTQVRRTTLKKRPDNKQTTPKSKPLESSGNVEKHPEQVEKHPEQVEKQPEQVQNHPPKVKRKPKPKRVVIKHTKSPMQLMIAEQEKAAEKYLESIEEPLSRLCYADSDALFIYDTTKASEDPDSEDEISTTPSTDNKEEEDPFTDFQKNVTETINKRFSLWRNFNNALLKKEIRLMLKDGQGTMAEGNFDKWVTLKDELDVEYKKAYVCKYKSKNCNCAKKINCDFKLDPEISEVLETSRDPAELEYYFTAWHDAVGTRIKSEKYEEFINLSNQQAQGNGFSGNVAMWADSYNEYTRTWKPSKFKKMVLYLWDELKPYYKILHAYVRMMLSKYPAYNGKIKRCGYIPVHLLGNMFGQSWTNVDDITKPFPNTPSLDATAEMKKQNYTPKKMLQLADGFFQSLGLKKLPPAFWEKSVYVKPKNVDLSCHPAAYDMCLGRFGADYRLSMCATVNQRDFGTMHHELGHIQYMMQYSHLRYAFRSPANPGFDESIGDVLAMSVTTPEHLQCKLGLNLGIHLNCSNEKQKDYPVTETDINYLYIMALESLAFFPFSITMDSWRWLIMDGKLHAKDFNTKWWEMRRDLQGVIPPKERSSKNFDPAAKFHVVAHVSYISYFMSTIFQYDFYEALCKAAGQFDPSDPHGKPLYKCDFTGSKKAGKLFSNMLKKGNKTPWPQALKALTGRDCVTTQPMLNYFKPLFEKLKQLLEEGGESDCLGKEWS